MFNLIDIGERAGSGVPNIFSVWHKQGWQAPVIEEFFDPDRIKVTLPMKNIEKLSKSDDKKVTIKTEAYRNAIITY